MDLNVIIKGDVQGSVEVLNDAVSKLSNNQVRIRILYSSVGAVSTNDVLLASASEAIVIGFNVRPQRDAQELAKKEGVDIRLHTVIYELLDEMKLAMTGLLEPTLKEAFQGRAEVRDTFKVPKSGTIAGCFVREGLIPRTANVEEGRQTSKRGRMTMDATRFNQFGRWRGSIRYGGRTLAIDPKRTYGTKDRSWGIRPVGAPDPGGAPPTQLPQVFFLWAPLQWAERCTHMGSFEDADGHMWHWDGMMYHLVASSLPTGR